MSSSIALAFKSWWKPSFTFNISGIFLLTRIVNELFIIITSQIGLINKGHCSAATRDRRTGSLGYGYGLRIENLREARFDDFPSPLVKKKDCSLANHQQFLDTAYLLIMFNCYCYAVTKELIQIL